MPHKGFTLIELLLIMALVTVIGATTFPLGVSFYRSQILSDTTAEYVSALRRAQNKALTQTHDSSFGVFIMPGSYTLFEGGSYESRITLEDEVFPLSESIEATGLTEVVFAKGSGMPHATGTITIVLHGNEHVVQVRDGGIIE